MLTPLLGGIAVIKIFPVACTLASADRAAQQKRWERLVAEARTGRTVTAEGLRMSFRPEAEDELRALAAVETGCCSWASWTVERTAEAVVLDVRAGAAAGVATLRAMFR